MVLSRGDYAWADDSKRYCYPPNGLDTSSHEHAPVKVDATKRDVSSLYIKGLAVTVFKKGKINKDHMMRSASTITEIRYVPDGKVDPEYQDQTKRTTFTYIDGKGWNERRTNKAVHALISPKM